MRREKTREIDLFLDECERLRLCSQTADQCLRKALEVRRRRGLLVSPRPGLYARTQTWKRLPRTERELWVLHAIAALRPGWTFCHASAALAHGLYVSHRRLCPEHIATSPGSRHSSCRLAKRHVIDDPTTTVASGVAVTSLRRTALDCLRTLPEPEALAIADSTLRRGGMSKDELLAHLEHHGRRRRNIKRALDIVRIADARSESGGESMARHIMIANGFPLPDLQRPIPNPDNPSSPYRVDFYWELDDGTILIGEMDGIEKYENPEMTGGRSAVRVMSDERMRESRLTLMGARIMRFGFHDVTRPERLVRLLLRFGLRQA